MSVSVALNPDGSVSSKLPDNAREKFEYQMAKFKRLFGSAAEHGLDDGVVAPKKFCPPELSLGWGDKIAENLGSILLLSEVAVKATIDSVALGFSAGGSPKALVRLKDVEPLTRRSPSPEYAVFPIGQLVARGHVFCGNRGQIGTGEYRGPYQPRAGSRIVVTGGWRDGEPQRRRHRRLRDRALIARAILVALIAPILYPTAEPAPTTCQGLTFDLARFAANTLPPFRGDMG